MSIYRDRFIYIFLQAMIVYHGMLLIFLCAGIDFELKQSNLPLSECLTKTCFNIITLLIPFTCFHLIALILTLIAFIVVDKPYTFFKMTALAHASLLFMDMVILYVVIYEGKSCNWYFMNARMMYLIQIGIPVVGIYCFRGFYQEKNINEV